MENVVRILIITDAFLPTRTSVAVMLNELAQKFLVDGHEVYIIVPVAGLQTDVRVAEKYGCHIISVKAFATKDISYAKRLIVEFINPFIIYQRLLGQRWFLDLGINGIIWYSPSIFWGPLIKRLKIHFKCRTYLILRDLFPDWAWHLKLIRFRPIFWLLKWIENFQYSQADCIGVQSPNNLTYFASHQPNFIGKAEVLWNWGRQVSRVDLITPSINFNKTNLANKPILIYTGNVGVAQDMGQILNFIHLVKDRADLGIAIIGRGSHMQSLREYLLKYQIQNILIHEEISSNEIPLLLKQCVGGLIFLDRRHKTHNIPGKLTDYFQAGLPVLAFINEGNDLVEILDTNKVGIASTSSNNVDINQSIDHFLRLVHEDKGISQRCIELSQNLHSVSKAASQIIKNLNQ